MTASEATEPAIPVRATAKVSHRPETEETTLRTAAEISPLPSATATPIMTTSTMPSGGNAVKLVIASDTICRMPSTDSRLTTSIVPSLVGERTLTPSADCTRLSTRTTRPRIRNSQNGCGMRLPARSMTSSIRAVKPRFRATGGHGVHATPPCHSATGV